MPQIRPMIIGLFYGKSKPKLVTEFLEPFVDETISILGSGLLINGNHLTVAVRAFICDSPARAFIKGFYKFFNWSVSLFLLKFNFQVLSILITKTDA